MDILTEIQTGKYDEQITELYNAVRERRKVVGAHEALDLRLRLSRGDTVRIRDDASLRPQYLLGTEWTITKINQKTAACTTNDDYVRTTKYGRGPVRIPLDSLEVVNSN